MGYLLTFTRMQGISWWHSFPLAGSHVYTGETTVYQRDSSGPMHIMASFHRGSHDDISSCWQPWVYRGNHSVYQRDSSAPTYGFVQIPHIVDVMRAWWYHDDTPIHMPFLAIHALPTHNTLQVIPYAQKIKPEYKWGESGLHCGLKCTQPNWLCNQSYRSNVIPSRYRPGTN